MGQVGNSQEIRILHPNDSPSQALNYITSANNTELNSFDRERAKDILFENSFHGFVTTEDAARNWSIYNNDKSKVTDREGGAGIFKVKLDNKLSENIEGTDADGTVSILTPTVWGGRNTINPRELLKGPEVDVFGVKMNLPMPGTLSAFVHSHGNGSYNFSGYEGDAEISRSYKVPVYLVNKRFEFKVWEHGVDSGADDFKGRSLSRQLPIFRYDKETDEVKPPK